MEIKIKLSEKEKEEYFSFLKKYIDNETMSCNSNKNSYFNQLKKDLLVLKKILPRSNEKDFISSGRRALKYLDMLESYRLAKYQYFKYSNFKKSYTESVYASITFSSVKNLKDKIGANLKIADIGCGPSRFTYDLMDIFENATFDLYDFSLTNLFLAEKLLCSNKEVIIPIRSINPPFMDKQNNEDISFLKIPGKNCKNVNFFVCNLERDIPLNVDSYDLINATHSINLLSNGEKIIPKLISKLKIGGILIISDLFGWKEDREDNRRFFSNGDKFYNFFKEMKNIQILDYWYGGPYIEEFNLERYDFYVNHSIVIKRIN